MNDWRETLPPELKDSPGLKDVKDVASLAKQFLDQQTHLGNSIRIPGPDAGDVDRKSFRDKLLAKVPDLIPVPNPDDPELMSALYRRFGQPEKPEGYEPPEGVNPEDVEQFREIAHKAGLTKKQFNQLVSDLAEYNGKASQMEKINIENGVKALRQEWGIAFEDRVSQVQKALVATGAPKDIQEAVKSGAVGPETMKWLHGIYKQLGAEGINLAGSGPGSPETSGRFAPAEAMSRINEIMNNKQHPYWVSDSPLHAAAVQEMVRLTEMAYPDTGDGFSVRRAG